MKLKYDDIKNYVLSNVIASCGDIRLWVRVYNDTVEYLIENMKTKETQVIYRSSGSV